MARTRSRRRIGRRIRRNAKGHFVKRSGSTRRRRHRNPSGFIKVGRRWKKITKFARRRRRGARRGQIAGFKFPRRYRRSRRRVHRNPVVVSNPARRRRVRRNPARHRRYVRRNPSVSYRLSSDPISAIKNAIMSAFSMDTVETLGQMGVGFGGSLWLAKMFVNLPQVPTTIDSMPYWKVGSTFLASALLAGASSLLKSPKLTARMLTGGLFATLWTAVSEAVKNTSAAQFIPTLSGTDDTFRKAIEAEVLKELRGGGVNGYLPAAGAEGYSTYLRPAGIEYLRPAGQEAYLTQTNTERANAAAGMSAFLTERESARVDARPSGVGDDAGEFGGRDLPERF